MSNPGDHGLDYGGIYLGYHIRMAALSLVLYDYALALDDEVELFWKRRPWTLTTYLFLWSRYGGTLYLIISICLITNTSPTPYHACQILYIVEATFGSFNASVMELILLLRLYALYNCSRRFAYVAAGCAFGIQLIFLSGFAAFVVGGVLGSMDVVVSGGMIYCKVTNMNVLKYLPAYWVPFAFFEVLVLILTMRKALQFRHSTLRLTNLVSTLVWDSIVYASLMEIVYIANIILVSVDTKYNDTLSGLVFTLPAVMTGRMMCNVRKSFCHDQYRRVPASPDDISLHFPSSNQQPQGPVVFRYL